MVEAATPHFEFTAGASSLDFVNTVWERPEYLSEFPEPPHELLNSVEDLVAWLKVADLFPQSEFAAVKRSLLENQIEASKYLEILKAFREVLFSVCLDVTQSKKLTDKSLQDLNKFIFNLPARKLSVREKSFSIEFEDRGVLENILTQLVSDAVQVLTKEDLSRLRICGADDCGWVFLDKSKNGKRRWCSMNDCGNRDKVKRFLKRKRG